MEDNSAAASSALSPTWTRPKTPLAPDRLAKLANALGVSTPIPSSDRQTFFLRSSSETPVSPDAFRRSPTPSMASAIAAGYTPSPTTAPTSKFLLHVIPPLHLPHDIGDSDDITAPPSTASGYHTQFRRGTLVPVHSSLQAQLAAIAKEYALPSTAGMILYLVSSGSSGAQSPTASSSSHSHSKSPSPWGMEDQDEPGPRLSEEIWRHLWIRVLQAEQRDMNAGFLLPSISRSPTPLMLSPTAARSTPSFLPSTSPLNTSNLRPPTPGSAISASTPTLPAYQSITNSPSTPSSFSDTRFSNFKTAPPSQSGGDSVNGDMQEPGTPDTSVDVHSQNGHSNMSQMNLLPLPGLNSNSLIPILAKVEFDIDSRKAGWYQPWVRSRKVNKAKRKGAKKGSGDEVEEEEGEDGEDAAGDKKTRELKDQKKKEKKPAIPLLTGNKEKIDWDAMVPPAPEPAPVVATEAELNGEGYTQLSDSDSDSEFDEDEFAEDSTAKVSSNSHGNKGDEDEDPLQDVFGRDEDTWRDIKAERRATHEIAVDSNPNVVNLALTAQELSNNDGDASLMTDDSHFTTPEEEEVRELLDRMSQGGRTPDLHAHDDLDGEDGEVGEDATVTSVTSASITSPKSGSQSFSGPSGKRHIPSPLILIPKVTSQAIITDVPSPMPGTAGLPYMDGSRSNSQDSLDGRDSDDDDDDDETYNYRAKTPSESDKRSGTLFEDVDLGLDPSEDYDDDDPNDRRRSQYVMRAQLDEIERALAQLSPQTIKSDLDEDGANQSMNQSFSSLAPNANTSLGSPSKFTMSPLGPGNAELSSPFASPNRPPTESSTSPPAAGASWPAIPFSQIKRGSSDSEPEAPSNANLNNRSSDPNQPPAPPQLALNGVTTSAPRSFAPRSNVNGEASAETLQRRKELEQEQALYGRKDQPQPARPSTPPPKPGGATDSPVIPLSPDPFGRFSSSTPDLPIIRNSSEKWDTATLVERNSVMTDKSGGRTRSGTTSRFSVDSIPEEQIPAAAPKAASKGTNLMSVKGIKNLWRKSNNNKAEKEKKEKEKEKESVPPTPNASAGSGRASPSSLVTLGGLLPTGKRSSGRVSPSGAPPRPDRPSGETFDLPDLPAMHPSASFGRVSPQPPTPTAPNTRPSSRASHESSRSRPSVELSRPMVPGKRPSVDYANARRPSMDVLMAAQQRRAESSQESTMPPMPPPPNGQNLAVPQRTPSNRGASPSGPSPIVPAQMLPSRGASAMDRFHFDQESPYPNPIRSLRGAPRTPSPTQQNLPHHQTHPSQSTLSSIAEGQVDRGQQPQKSILKRTTSAQAERELNQDRMSGMNGTNGLRIGSGRKGSVASHSSGETQSSSPPDGGMARRPSLAPSFVSQASSIDSSQFEFVSPKMNSGMAYPAAGYGSGPQDA